MVTNIAKTESELRSDLESGPFQAAAPHRVGRASACQASEARPSELRSDGQAGRPVLQAAPEGVHPRFHLENCRAGLAANELDALDFGGLTAPFGDRGPRRSSAAN